MSSHGINLPITQQENCVNSSFMIWVGYFQMFSRVSMLAENRTANKKFCHRQKICCETWCKSFKATPVWNKSSRNNTSLPVTSCFTRNPVHIWRTQPVQFTVWYQSLQTAFVMSTVGTLPQVRKLFPEITTEVPPRLWVTASVNEMVFLCPGPPFPSSLPEKVAMMIEIPAETIYCPISCTPAAVLSATGPAIQPASHQPQDCVVNIFHCSSLHYQQLLRCSELARKMAMRVPTVLKCQGMGRPVSGTNYWTNCSCGWD